MSVPTVGLFMGIMAIFNSTQAQQKAPKADAGQSTLSARIEVDAHEHCFTVRFFVKNNGKDEQKIERGWGGSGLEVVPRFEVDGISITPPTYLRPPRRSMRPNLLTVPAGNEVLYGTFTMGYPVVEREREEKLTAVIRFRELKTTLRTEAQKLKIPAWKGQK
jgi:hypothetical protein